MSPLYRARREYEVAHEAYLEALQAKETSHGDQSFARQDIEALYKAVVRSERRLMRLESTRSQVKAKPITFSR